MKNLLASWFGAHESSPQTLSKLETVAKELEGVTKELRVKVRKMQQDDGASLRRTKWPRDSQQQEGQ